MSFKEKYTDIFNIVRDEVSLVKKQLTDIFTDNSRGFEEDIIKFLNLPSKHIRAVIALLYLKACGYEVNELQVKLQTVIEIIHNASLIHDDIIDESLQRRGEKSFKANFGNHLSVIAGDLILAKALDILAELGSKELQLLISRTITNMCKGEISQEFSKFKIPAIDEYIEKTYQKTGALFEAAISGVELIAIGKISQSTKDFAQDFGIAFQIRDDILNITEKQNDSDIKNGIYTAPVIYSETTEVSDIGIEKAKGLLNNYVCKAKENIQQLKESEYKTAIIKLLELINYE